ncbi:hypothetical protein M0802_009976 [Mischocyttarus mexicanus]|nr:hypothetical protein M0802_009976 [Mischocyttarus mexicanus]
MLNVMLPRVEDLERSPQWTSLASDINNLEKFSYSRNPMFLMRTRQYEKRTCHRRSMPEIQKAKLISLNSLADEQGTNLNANEEFVHSESHLPYKWNWKPKSEFERMYFYGDYNKDGCGHSNEIHLEESINGMKFLNDYNVDQVSYNMEDLDKSKMNNLRSYRDRVYNISQENEEYSGSRERLHEIFEHNRYLRRQFFGISNTDNSHNNEDKSIQRSLDSASRSFNKNLRTEVLRQPAKFGSTETLTSQSNQSSVSSMNGRKSLTKSNSPELLEESKIPNFSRMKSTAESFEYDDKFNNSVHLKKKVEFERTNLDSVKDSLENNSRQYGRCNDRIENLYYRSIENSTNEVTESDGLKLLNLFESEIENRKAVVNSSQFQNSNMERSKNGIRWSPMDEYKHNWNPEDFCQSMPDLSNRDDKLSNIARLSVNGTKMDFGNSINIRGPIRSICDDDRKYYASCVQLNVPENRLPRNGLKRIPPPLDLRNINEKYEMIENSERKYLKNYTVDVALLRDYDRPNECQLTTVIDDSNQTKDNFAKIKSNEDSISKSIMKTIERKSTSGTLNKSLNNLSYWNDLQSPQLVNNYKNSMIDLRNGNGSANDLARSSRVADQNVSSTNSETTSPLADRVRTIGGPHSGTGSTLPSVYGPIPYSQ